MIYLVFGKKKNKVPLPPQEAEAKTETKELDVGGKGEEKPGVIKIDPEIKPTLDMLSKRYAGIFQTTLNSDVIQRDETNTLLLALLHEQIRTNALLSKALEEDQ